MILMKSFYPTGGKEQRYLFFVEECLNLGSFAVRSEDVFNFVGDQLFDVAAAVREVLTRVEVGRLFLEMFANARRHGKTQI